MILSLPLAYKDKLSKAFFNAVILLTLEFFVVDLACAKVRPSFVVISISYFLDSIVTDTLFLISFRNNRIPAFA